VFGLVGEKISAYLFLVPAIVMVVLFLLIPAGYTIVVSLTKWDGLSTPKFTGFGNYFRFIQDTVFLTSLKNTIIWVIFTLALSVLLGLLIAYFVNRVRFASFFKAVFYIPLTISAVTTGLIWLWMYSPDLGVINTALTTLGFSGKSWMSEVPLNTYSMIFSWTWKTVGTNMVIFLIGLQAIPVDPVEAVKLDGATEWQTFRHVVFPMLKPITTVVVSMSLINSFNIFDIIYVMTGGGPYRSSETLAVSMFRESFVLFHMGYGASIAIFLSAIVLFISWIYIREVTRHELKY
jgi:ABC-type sugar transport system permease subunit